VRALVYLALRLLLRDRLSLVMLLAAVACGVGFQIPSIANLAGYSRELFTQGVEQVNGHVVVSAASDESLPHVPGLIANLHRLPFVKNVAPRLLHGGVLFSGNRYQAVRILGVDPGEERTATELCDQLKVGECLEEGSSADEIVLGSGVGRMLHATVGSVVRLYLPYEDLGELGQRKQVLKVKGVLGSSGGFSAIDGAVFLDRAKLGELLEQGRDAATSLHVFVARPQEIDSDLPAIRDAVRPNLARPWWEINAFVSRSIDASKVIGQITLLMVLIAVIIPVLAVFTINVLRERPEIATMAAIGLSRCALFGVYFTKTVIIAACGTLLGTGIGLTVCRYFDQRPIFSHSGFVIRPELNLTSLLVPVLAVFGAALLAGVWPAMRAARSNPAKILKRG